MFTLYSITTLCTHPEVQLVSPQRIMVLVVTAALLVTYLTLTFISIYSKARQSKEGCPFRNPKKRTPLVKHQSALCSFGVVCLAMCVSVISLYSFLTALSWLVIMARDAEFSSKLQSE